MEAADIRAEIARHRVRLYELAPAIGVHPTRLGRMLNGRRPLPEEIARRIMRALTTHSKA